MKEAYAQSIECEEPCEGDFHARLCERVRVKLPRSTRPWPPFIGVISKVFDYLVPQGNQSCGIFSPFFRYGLSRNAN